MTCRSRPVMLDHDAHCVARTRIAIDLPTAPSLATAFGECAPTPWDALPLLRLAHRVPVIDWSATADPTRRRRRRHDALTQWLPWQGVVTESRRGESDGPNADAMRSCAADPECDLLVMGACGHARRSERVPGGATRGLLAGVTLPVPVSH